LGEASSKKQSEGKADIAIIAKSKKYYEDHFLKLLLREGEKDYNAKKERAEEFI